jgi:site-specific recombinase XerD
LGPEHIRQYQVHLFRERKLSSNSVRQRVAALRFFFVKTLRRHCMMEHIPFAKEHRPLPTVFSQEEVSPHGWRHTYATHQLEAGVDLPTLQNLMGHADIRDTAIYLHVSKRHLQAASSPLEALQISDAASFKRPHRKRTGLSVNCSVGGLRLALPIRC